MEHGQDGEEAGTEGEVKEGKGQGIVRRGWMYAGRRGLLGSSERGLTKEVSLFGRASG